MSQEAETFLALTRFNAFHHKYAVFVFHGLKPVNKHASVIKFVIFICFDSEGWTEPLGVAHCSFFDTLIIIIDNLIGIYYSFRTNTLKVAYLRVLVIMFIGVICLFRSSDLLILTLTQFIVSFCSEVLSEVRIDGRP